MSEAKTFVDSKLESKKKVIVFSKTNCSFCTKAKEAFKHYLGGSLAPDDYEVIEIDNNPLCDEIQDYLLKLTGGRSVPRVFINQKFLGGGDETQAAHKSGELQVLLKK